MKAIHYIVIIVLLSLLGISLLALPIIVRALPGRYASLLPEPLQALRHTDHPLTLPTPVAAAEVEATVPPSATPLPSLTPTRLPTLTPEPSVTPSPTASPTAEPPTPTPTPTLPPAVLLEGLRHERQGWNNCGPTTLGMALSYWGRTERQAEIAPLLKPDPEDKHVGIQQMAEYAESLGLRAIVRSGGTLEELKQLLSAGFPVIVRTWYVRDARDQLGHYRLAIGYNDTTQRFDLYDSLYDPPTSMDYTELYELWRVFNWSYLVVASPERWDELTTMIGADMDDVTMYEQALARAEMEGAAAPETCAAYASCSDWTTFSWYAIGTNLTALGRHAEAAAAFDQARQLGLHYRMLWYQHSPYESYYAVGRYDDVVALADATLATANNLEESYYWRGMARLAQGDQARARADFETALRYHRDWEPAVEALAEMNP